MKLSSIERTLLENMLTGWTLITRHVFFLQTVNRLYPPEFCEGFPVIRVMPRTIESLIRKELIRSDKGYPVQTYSLIQNGKTLVFDKVGEAGNEAKSDCISKPNTYE